MSISSVQSETVPMVSVDALNDDLRKLYPFSTKSHRIGPLQMNYVDEGNGDPVLMVHGNPTWSFYWRGLIQALKPTHRTIAVDHVGCGLSDKPTDYPYCLQQHIDNLCSLVDSLDLSNVTLMAHDWGGAIGLGALLKRRERFKRIVLFNTAAFPPPYIPFRIRVCRWPLFGKLAVQGFNAFARAAVTMATEQTGGLNRDVAQGLLAPYDSWKNRTAIYHFVKDIPLSKSHPTWKVLDEIESQLPSLSELPILLAWGMKDWCFRPECLRRFQTCWPNANVYEIGDAGHYVVEDAAHQVEKYAADFLNAT